MRLINMPYTQLDWFEGDWERVREFLQDNKLQGIELILSDAYDAIDIPPGIVKGLHLAYWPMWLDFWRGDLAKLLTIFGQRENIERYYGGLKRSVLIDYHRRELEIAQALQVDYVVFHVSHVELTHTYTRAFTYSDWDVLEAGLELINEVFGERDLGFPVLFENMWCPGLTFLHYENSKRFFEQVAYPNKGLMLDTGHMMATSPVYQNEVEACSYLLHNLEQLKDLQPLIRGAHLNKSLSGGYLMQGHEAELNALNSLVDFWDKLAYSQQHIRRIDRHQPFDHPQIKEVLARIKPDFLVFELLPQNRAELEQMIQSQNRALR